MIKVEEGKAEDREWCRRLLADRWSGPLVVTRGLTHDASRLPVLIAWDGKERVGLATYLTGRKECEVLTLDAVSAGKGVGTALLAAVEEIARFNGCRRVWLITTNDNLDAIRFYQRRGYRLVTVHRGALEDTRRIKPSLPERGCYGIPLWDEIEMEKLL